MTDDVLVSPNRDRQTAPSSKTDRRNAAWDIEHGPRNFLALIGSQAAIAVLSFTSVWIAIRALGSAGYGGVVAVIAASQFVAQVAVNWTVTAIPRYGCEEFVETGKVSNTFWTRLIVLIPYLALIVCTAPLWLPPAASRLHIPRGAYLLVIAYFLATTLWIHIQQTLLAVKLARLQSLLLIVERTQILVVLLALLASGRGSLFSVALAYIVGPFGASAIGLWSLRRLIYPGIRVDRLLLRRMFLFSLPLIPATFVGYFSTSYLDAVFISYYLSPADLALYAVAYQLAGIMMQIPLLAGSLLITLFVSLQVNSRSDLIDRFLRDVVPFLTLIWAGLCSLVPVFGRYFLKLIFGPEYEASANLLWPLMVAATFSFPWLVGLAPYLSAKTKTYVFTVQCIVAGCANVGLNFLLVPRGGLLGCAWATAGSYAASMLIGVYFVRRAAPSSQGWVLQAVLPILASAGFATWKSNALTAALISFVSVALIAIWQRKHIQNAISILEVSGVLHPLFRVLPGEWFSKRASLSFHVDPFE
jgi:O-antigen/teichoic acid export membrane protein